MLQSYNIVIVHNSRVLNFITQLTALLNVAQESTDAVTELSAARKEAAELGAQLEAAHAAAERTSEVSPCFS